MLHVIQDCGEEMKVDSIVYEADSYDLGGASFIALETEKFAISDAGLFSRQFNIQCSKYWFATTAPKLYHSSRHFRDHLDSMDLVWTMDFKCKLVLC
ncbi:hypothetical protein Patl1_11689 [Pistacia atlantica]|uniref:Uncharacterized protein n=1 Tax=Pistacia atlantica TaxID=434234 RepID=A0ACC1ABQ7_9ROSI|nr:hypothetical protein Patl1_11689 [Pistacia atlantica]